MRLTHEVSMIDKLAKQLFNDINDKVTQFEQNAPGASQLKTVLESTLRKLNLVTREEFDAQQAVLLRTREKLEALEKQIDALLADKNNAQ